MKVLKMLIKGILRFFISLWSSIYTYGISQRLVGYKNILYTLWIRKYIGHVGDNSSIAKPCSLQGGGQKRIFIGDHTNIQSHCILGCWENYGNQSFTPSITIGDDCNIGEYNHITACDKITIGDGLLTGRYVYIGDNSHGGVTEEESLLPPAQRNLISKGEIVIGNNVWIGDKVTILAGVHIDDNVIVAANAVVTKDIQSNSIVAGVPAVVIKTLKRCQDHK